MEQNRKRQITNEGNTKGHIKWKLALLEAENKMLIDKKQMLEGTLENKDWMEKIRKLMDESKKKKLKEENMVILRRLKEAQEKEQIANDKLEKIMNVIDPSKKMKDCELMNKLVPIPINDEHGQQEEELEVIQQNHMEKEKADELQSALNDTQQEQDKIKEQHPKQQQKEYVPNIRAEKQKEKSYKEDEEEEEEQDKEEDSDSDTTGYEVEEILKKNTLLKI